MLLAFWKRPELFRAGVTYTTKKLLQASIILLGFGMNLFVVFEVGSQTLVLMLFTLSATFFAAYVCGKALEVEKNTNILIGVGTAICGGSAIAATAPVIQADDEEVARAISTIFLFNVIAAFLFPALGHLLHLNDFQFGLWAGTAVNDTSCVVAAGYTFSDTAGNLAVIVKLTRTLMIIPITLGLAFYTAQKKVCTDASQFQIIKIFPFFILGFVAASVIRTFTPIPAELSTGLVELGKFLIVMAMAGIGLNTNIINLVKNGWKPILLGLICWVVLSLKSLIVQFYLLG